MGLSLYLSCIDRGDTAWGFRDPDSSRNDIGAYGGPRAVMARPVYPKGIKADAGDSTVGLSWMPNPEGDIWWYAVYRGDCSGFFPSESTLIAQVAEPAWVDSQVTMGKTYRYRVAAVNSMGYGSGYSQEVEGRTGVRGRKEERLPTRFFLSQNYPNPFNSNTAIGYQQSAISSQRSAVSLKIYNILGQEIKTLIDEKQAPGYYSVLWDGTNQEGKELPSGVYLYRLRAGRFSQTRKMVLIR